MANPSIGIRKPVELRHSERTLPREPKANAITNGVHPWRAFNILQAPVCLAYEQEALTTKHAIEHLSWFVEKRISVPHRRSHGQLVENVTLESRQS